MSIVNECLKQILSARYGKDVRQSIHDGIKEVDSVARTAQNSATANAQTASAKASEALKASQEALKKAQEAQESAQQAKTYAENAEAVTGVNIATQDRAGIVKGGENHIAEDGTLELVVNTTETTMPNSRKGGLLIDEIGGACEQATTTGAQLFDGNLKNGYRNTIGGSLAGDTDLYKTIDFEVSEPGEYAFTFSELVNMIRKDGETPNVDGTFFIYRLQAGSHYISFRRSDNAAWKDSTEIMFTKGESMPPWEPYTGGVPSPSPEYPQEIKKSVVSEIKAHGKNLFAFGKTAINRTDELRPNYSQRLQMSLVNDNDLNKIKCGFRNGEWTSGYVTIYGIDGTKDYSISYDIEENTTIYTPVVEKYNSECDSTKLTLVISSGNKNNIVADTEYFILSNIQVELGTATEYEPFTENIIFFMNPIELCGCGDVQDVVAEGFVKRRFKEVVFDGSSDENWIVSTLASGRFYIDGVSNSVKVGTGMCTHFIHENGATTEILNRSYFSGAVDGRFIVNTSFASVDEWKAHLQANPMTVVYELAEEEIEELSVPYKITFNSLPTYDGTTYLEFNSDVKPTSKCRYATSLVGSVAIESLLKERNNELKIALLEATAVNNI